MLSSILNDMRVLFIVVDLELIKFISYDFFFWLLLWLLLNDIDIMLLETLGHWILLRPLTLVLDGSYLVMSNQFRVLLLRNSEVMVTQDLRVAQQYHACLLCPVWLFSPVWFYDRLCCE